MVRIIIFILFIFNSTLIQAQLSDLMGNLVIQGSITQQSTQSVGQGLSSLQKLQVLQDIQQISIEIQTLYFGSYQNISKKSLSKNYLSNFNWDLVGENNLFYIQLSRIDDKLCDYLVKNKLLDSDIQVNENKDKNCRNTNMIRYYFR